MNCPVCENLTKVINSRQKLKQYRRRECHTCGHRFTTYEVSQMSLLDMFDDHLSVEVVDEISRILEYEFPEVQGRDSKRGLGASASD